jgi:hypothetical protein
MVKFVIQHCSIYLKDQISERIVILPIRFTDPRLRAPVLTRRFVTFSIDFTSRHDLIGLGNSSSQTYGGQLIIQGISEFDSKEKRGGQKK